MGERSEALLNGEMCACCDMALPESGFTQTCSLKCSEELNKRVKHLPLTPVSTHIFNQRFQHVKNPNYVDVFE